jgi:hypothetical protein
VQHDGKLYASNANIKGHIEATSGSFENIEFKNRIDVSNLPLGETDTLGGQLFKANLWLLYKVDKYITTLNINNVLTQVVTSVVEWGQYYHLIGWK